MNEAPLVFENPIRDAISSVRFAPISNNLLISSWDNSLRLFDVGSSVLRLEASDEASLLDCCFQNEFVAFSAGSDGSIRRYDLSSGISDAIGSHDDISTCVRYSDETCQVITAGLDKKLLFWDTRMENDPSCLENLGSEVFSMSLAGFDMMVAVRTSVFMYDLRYLGGSVQSRQLDMDVQINCVSSVPYSRGFAVGSVDGRVKLDISFSPSDDIRYMFRCHPKSADKRFFCASVNDIVFNPHIKEIFVTGDDGGYVSAWNAQSRRRLFELPRYPNSVASLSINQGGQFLAVASSYTYQEAREIEELPQIFIHEIDNGKIESTPSGSSSRN
ncbi:hypothetical protein UlMin_041104 [Ulmus minor]